ncbi:MAG TPA: helix-turn-helix transcriptional regulator [Sphingobium sp.]|uniref:helix-turn-helix transcriptional regulator n=1 Tax=Sphingobium sp. TaxID=1912891 RepID=UPI002ED66028
MSEGQLVAALFDGLFEEPLWSSFLEMLRLKTDADHAVLSIAPRNHHFNKAIFIRASRDAEPHIDETARDFHFAKDLLDDRVKTFLEEGRVYSLQDLYSSETAARDRHYLDVLRKVGMSAMRQMWIQEKSGINAQLTITRAGDDFTAEATDLLRSLVPVLRGVLQVFVSTEQERFAASLNAETIRRLRFGWIVLNRSGIVLECDEQGGEILTGSGVLKRRSNGKLEARDRDIEREIYQALSNITEDSRARPRAIIISRDPWLDMLIVPARDQGISTNIDRAAIAYVHGDSWRSADRHEQLAELFGLSPREARLALAISRGLSLTEAAAELGLTVGTARQYSKSTYAKMGVRGLPDLVRIVSNSALVIPSDSPGSRQGKS